MPDLGGSGEGGGDVKVDGGVGGGCGCPHSHQLRQWKLSRLHTWVVAREAVAWEVAERVAWAGVGLVRSEEVARVAREVAD